MKYFTFIIMALLLAWLLPAMLGSLILRVVAASFVGGLRYNCATANSSALEGSIAVADMRFNGRTANGALSNALYRSARMPLPESGAWQHGRITAATDDTFQALYTGGGRTANAGELFTSTHFSEPMTNYAVGWSDPEGYDALTEFLAPNFQAPGELFEHLVFNNAEEFLSDGTDADLRAINADFLSVDYTQDKATRRVDNRGLRIELDWDRIKNNPNWQAMYTGKLLTRLKRNQTRRAAALEIASATSAGLTWGGATVQPDILLNNEIILSANASGIRPNRMLIGEQAWQIRMASYGASASVSAAAGLSRTVEQVGALLNIQTMMDSARYQTGATKTQIIGANVLMFTGKPGVDTEDATNLKLAWVPCQNGTRYAVYVRQISVKKWEIVVEHYEKLFCASTLGVRLNPITAS